MIKLQHQTDLAAEVSVILLSADTNALDVYLDDAEKAYLKTATEQEHSVIYFNRLSHHLWVVVPLAKNLEKKQDYQIKEVYRQLGHEVFSLVKKLKVRDLHLVSPDLQQEVLAFAEGFALSTYQFEKYKAKKNELSPETLSIISKNITSEAVLELQNLLEANFLTRHLVNEPVLFLTAWQFAEEMRKAGSEAGFEVTVLDEDDIKSEKMTGLLTVNKGSVDPPTFTVMEYKPENAQNEQPFVLVGKGVVYDTGGLSLKPTAGSMDFMKCDMGGAGAVVGAMYAIAKNNLPLHVVGLVPATDNRPGGNAITPGDVIEMMNGKTVEILNTDAEGRLILADALCYAERYDPALVIDLATLTGAALIVASKEGAALMGNDEAAISQLKAAGLATYERLVELPIWEEFGDMLKSDIADISNLGGREAGTITAAKFLEHFTNYPWMHLDVAGTAYLPNAPYKYWGKNATGFGVRLLYQFFKEMVK